MSKLRCRIFGHKIGLWTRTINKPYKYCTRCGSNRVNDGGKQ